MRQGALIGPIIIAIGLIAAAIVFAVVGAILQTADGGTELRLDRAETQILTLSDEVRTMSEALSSAQRDLERLVGELALLAGQPRTAPADVTLQPEVPIQEVDDNELPVATEDMTEVMQLAKSRFNKGIAQPRNSTMLELLGQPRSSYDTTCQTITNPALRAMVETRQTGPIRATLLRPALDSLQRILDKLKATEPDIYAALGTAGGLCVRLIRGSTTSISNHSFGTAIDLKLEGKLDGFADGGTQFGLLLIAELFNEEGWFWGATYRREDSMHFEVGEETLRRWRAEGQI